MCNCAIGGTSASKFNKGDEIDYYADKLNFYNLSDIICTGNEATVTDNVSNLSLSYYDAYSKVRYMVGTDPSKEDIMIINYGTNDAFMRVNCSSDDKFDVYTFGGAIRKGVDSISKKYPDLKIVLPEVNYATIIEVGENDEEYDAVTEEYRIRYNIELEKIADEYDNVYYFALSDHLNVNKDNYDQYLFDGIHFKDSARKQYAKILSEYLLSLE